MSRSTEKKSKLLAVKALGYIRKKRGIKGNSDIVVEQYCKILLKFLDPNGAESYSREGTLTGLEEAKSSLDPNPVGEEFDYNKAMNILNQITAYVERYEDLEELVMALSAGEIGI